MHRLATAALLVLVALAPAGVRAETPPEQEAAAQALRGVASNIQKNRDGTVRFVRFSKPTVTDAHLEHVRAFEQLDFLAVVTPTVSGAGLQHVAGLTNLDTLDLTGSGLTDAGTSIFRGLTKLERLYLDDTAVTDAGLEPLAGSESLTTLTARNTGLTDAGLKTLATLPKLDTLALAGTQVTDAGISHLAELPELRVLELDGTAITGASLSKLAALPKLEVLSLAGTQVKADDLAVLAEAKSLKHLLLYDTAVRSDALSELRKTLPKVTVNITPSAGNERNAFQRLLAGESLREAAPKDAVARESTNETESSKLLAPADERFADADAVPDFRRHVVPLLGRLGCNGRSCHGSFQGRGGFRLSMFGYDFAADHEALTGGDEPRVNVAAPDESLVIRKPTFQVDHGGGERFEVGSWQHRLLRNWIADGAKGVAKDDTTKVELRVTPAEIVFREEGETVPLRVTAVWSDGTREDVTPLTRFQSNDDALATVTEDGVVKSLRPGETHVVAFYDDDVFAVPVMRPVSDRTGERYPKVPTPTAIDELVVQKLSKLGVVPSERCSDEAFLRRVSLDVAGTLPTPEEIRAFLADSSPDKRARKIDELLQTPAYVEWWTMRLADLTGANAQQLGSTDMNRAAADQWVAWLRRRVRDNVGWDRIAAGLVLAISRRPGQTYAEYAAEQSRHLDRSEPTDFTALDNPMHYYWFRGDIGQPADAALSFGYVFMGVRLQCAQCHKHPFDRWSQRDFELFTQFFTRIERGIAPEAREAQLQLKTRLGVPKKLDTAALRRQMYMRVSAEGRAIPWNEIWIEPPGDKPQPAKLLGGAEFDLNDFDDPREPLMAWLLSEGNPYFAKAFVNRVWAHYFGRGIVEPADDFNMANPPSNAPLLDWLADGFVAHGYDLKWLHRTIANSRTYQLDWRTNATNAADERNFSHAPIRRLPAEVTVDAILQATAADARNATYATDVAKRKITQHPLSFQARGIDYSLLVFGKPLRTTNCDCERQTQPTLVQSLYVRNDTELLGWLERKDGWLAQTAGSLGETLSPESTTAAKTEPKAETAEPPSAERLDELVELAYLRTVGRFPNGRERERSREHLTSVENTSEGLRDLVWALLNTREFLTNH